MLDLHISRAWCGIFPLNWTLGLCPDSLASYGWPPEEGIDTAIPKIVGVEMGLRVQWWGCGDNNVGPLLWSQSPPPVLSSWATFLLLSYKSLIYSLYHSQRGPYQRAGMFASALAPFHWSNLAEEIHTPYRYSHKFKLMVYSESNSSI